MIAPSFKNSKQKWEYEIIPYWNKLLDIFNSNNTTNNLTPIKIKLEMSDVVSGIIGVVIGIWYISTKHWIANNIFGFAFSIQGIALLSLGSYKIGCILLCGLFLYDIFWVFGTDVMVTVAKSFDAPVKLLFPKDLFASELQYSMLGLGDIVIPGIFIALLLRFDKNRNKNNNNNNKKGNKNSFAKTYFTVCFIAYTVGLITTVFIMHTFQAAQPALLYLVPACIGSSALLAIINGDLSSLLAYTEDFQKKD